MKAILIRACGSFGLVFFIFGFIARLIAIEGFFLWIAYAQLFLGVAMMAIYLGSFYKDSLKAVASNRERLYAAIGGALFVFCVIGLNVVAHSNFGERRFDMTANKIHSLSVETKQILRQLEEPIQIMSFVVHPQVRQHAKRLVDRYTYESTQISFREVDPNLDPPLLERFQVSENQVLVYNPSRESSSVLSADQLSEQGLTMAIYRVAAGTTPTVYFLQGSGESELESQGATGLLILKILMEREGYQVRPLALSLGTEIPEDADAVVLWGPSRSLPPFYEEVLLSYLEAGGDLVIGLSPIYNPNLRELSPTGLERLLSEFGVSAPSRFVVQEIAARQARTSSFIWQAFGVDLASHPITDAFADEPNAMFQFRFALPILFESESDELQSVSLVSTNEQTRLSSDVSGLLESRSPRLDEESGPFSLARLIVRRRENQEESRLILFANPNFVQNSEIQSGFNRELFLGAVDYLTERDQAQFIRPRSFQSSTLDLTDSQRMGVFFASIFLFPQLIMLFGLGVWTFRRSRQ